MMGKLRNNEKGFGAIEGLLIVVVVVLLGVVGYMVYKNHNKTTASVTTTTATKPTTTPAKTTTPAPKDPTAGWATYTSTLGGFSFKYPNTGWSLDGFQGETPVGSGYSTGSMNGSETQVRLFEGTSSVNTYSIIININKDPSQVASETSNQYPNGTVSTLSNGLQVWETSASAAKSPQCFEYGASGGAPIDLNLVSNGNFDMKLNNGEYMSYFASWCYGQKTTTTYNYQQQVSSPEWTIAKEVLNSLKQQ